MFLIKEYFARRKNSYFGTSLHEKIEANPLPQVFLLIFASGFFYLFLLNIHYLSDFLYWFVGVLEITKVLKIPFLDHIKYYQYLTLFFFLYISISLLSDVATLLGKLNTKLYLVKNEIWMIKRHGLGDKLTKFTNATDNIQIEWVHSGSLNFLGLNRIVWKKEDHILAHSPYFFPYGKNKKLLNQILNR